MQKTSLTMLTQKLTALGMVCLLTLPGCVAARQQAANSGSGRAMGIGDVLRTMQRVTYRLPEQTPAEVAAYDLLVSGDSEFARRAVAVESGRADGETARRVASRFMEEGIFHHAVPIYDRLRENPDHAVEANSALTRIWMEWGNPEAALPYARAFTELDPSFESWDALGRIYLRLNRPQDAIVTLTRALVIRQESTTEANIGYAYLLDRQWAWAVHHLETALDLGADGEQVHNNLGIALARLGQGEAALEHFSQFNDPAAAYNNLGMVYMTERRWTEARDAFAAVLEADSGYPGAAENLARANGYIPPPAFVNLGPARRAPRVIDLESLPANPAAVIVDLGPIPAPDLRRHLAIVDLPPLEAPTPAQAVSADTAPEAADTALPFPVTSAIVELEPVTVNDEPEPAPSARTEPAVSEFVADEPAPLKATPEPLIVAEPPVERVPAVPELVEPAVIDAAEPVVSNVGSLDLETSSGPLAVPEPSESEPAATVASVEPRFQPEEVVPTPVAEPVEPVATQTTSASPFAKEVPAAVEEDVRETAIEPQPEPRQVASLDVGPVTAVLSDESGTSEVATAKVDTDAPAGLQDPVRVTLGYAAFWLLPLALAGLGFRIHRVPGLLVGLAGGTVAGSTLLTFFT